ncbi:nuclear transport factor 2 family protein [Aeromicrobium chenweiae]|uniref:Uncharacterized protein n=1 Tax=Aeromicrobium chenweiae TaxID=2079793 RepID=A0A2S0WLR3_9ACTN|nr:nuclear transport factor 2 family protein [Aeromicrobium chenweiae]AWB92265.1 hypothetical protein C3E78_08665 [Aeromicrobium chenweiae]TGN31452.1 nuclear transport factor 2 family protein [Aeromicrobium chenweiae]
MTHRFTIAQAITPLFDPSVDLQDAVERHFSPSFRRRADDGQWGGRDELAASMAQLREAMASATIEVHDELIDDHLYADRHTVRVVMKDGSVLRTEVYVFARHDADGRFQEIREATVLLLGDRAPHADDASH